MKNKKEIIKKFREYLQEQGLRYTEQREAVLKKILDTKGHFEIEEIVHKFKIDNVNVSRATIYRTLHILREIGIITEVIKYKNKTIYEVGLKHHHDHLICRKCGKIIEFHSDELERLQNDLCENYKFKPEFHRLEIYGLCNRCRTKKES